MLATAAALLAGGANAQKFDEFGRGRAREMLRNISDDVRKGYYDPTLHGLDFDARVREADQKLQRATSVTEAYRLIAWVLGGLNDSATYFMPPPRGYNADYGLEMQMVGSHCYVIWVSPKTDAEGKGLKAGDEVLSVNGTPVTRDSFRTLEYILYRLSPQPELQLQVRTVVGQQSTLKVAAKVEALNNSPASIVPRARDFMNQYARLKRSLRPRCQDLGDELEICKVPDLDIENQQIDEVLSLARKHQALIVDLRGNHYGTMEALRRLVGGVFDHEVKIGDQTTRGGTKPQVAASRHDPFAGKLAVLLDSESKSAAEMFARVVQLEKRGIVLGDRSAGAVRESKRYEYHFSTEPQEAMAIYWAMITESDTIMADGQSLEGKGVTPDEVLLPTAAALAGGYDPVLARAAERLGVKLAPDQAGKLLPYDRPRE
jgi:carboxyl-terminal processing protease